MLTKIYSNQYLSLIVDREKRWRTGKVVKEVINQHEEYEGDPEQMIQLERAAALAARVMLLARDNIMVNLRFLDVALSELIPEINPGLDGAAIEGRWLYYNPVWLLKQYKIAANYPVRLYLHSLFHCIFYHSFGSKERGEELWNLATDAAAENVILEMELPMAGLESDAEARNKLHYLKEDVGMLTAERIYHYLQHNPLTSGEKEQWQRLFCRDQHKYWRQPEELVITQAQWKKISERIKADLKSFSKNKSNSESLEKNLAEATRDRYDYADLLRRFAVMGEELRVNEDEFDYIYYTYGLSTYGNMPLIEPLEYKDRKKVREFVIAIDTSASCRGEIVREFIKKTYSILKGTEYFFQKINVHIVQCDSEIQSDTKITCEEDFQTWMKHGKLKGFGSTDFRPVFEYVERLMEEGEFENLKGLIYFTDGYGIYPQQMPPYDTIFAFLEEDDRQPEIPPWAIRVVLSEEDIEGVQTK